MSTGHGRTPRPVMRTARVCAAARADRIMPASTLLRHHRPARIPCRFSPANSFPPWCGPRSSRTTPRSTPACWSWPTGFGKRTRRVSRTRTPWAGRAATSSRPWRSSGRLPNGSWRGLPPDRRFPETARSLPLRSPQAWVNISPPGASNAVHFHPNSHYSGVYYAQTADNCGEIYFKDPRTPELMYRPPIASETGFTATEVALGSRSGPNVRISFLAGTRGTPEPQRKRPGGRQFQRKDQRVRGVAGSR